MLHTSVKQIYLVTKGKLVQKDRELDPEMRKDWDLSSYKFLSIFPSLISLVAVCTADSCNSVVVDNHNLLVYRKEFQPKGLQTQRQSIIEICTKFSFCLRYFEIPRFKN